MAGMPRLLAVARRPLSASLYRVVYSVADRLPAPATSAPVRDLVPRCSIPLSHGWEARVAVRAFSSSSAEGGGNGSAGPRESGPRPRPVKEQGDPKTKRRSRAKKFSPTSPPASGIYEERRGTYLTAEDPGLRDLGLGGVGVGAAGGIGKDLVAAVDTDASHCDVNAGAAGGIGMVSVNKDASDGIMNAEAASAIGKQVSVNKDASDGIMNAEAASAIGKQVSVNKDASEGIMNAEAASAIGKQVSVNKDASDDIMNAEAASAIGKQVSVNKDASDGNVNAGAASAMGEDSVAPDGGVHTGAGNDIAKVSVSGGVVTDAAGGMASEAGHGVGGTEVSPRKRRTRTTKAAAAAVPEKPEGDVAKSAKRTVRKAGVEKNAAPAPGKGSGGKGQLLVADDVKKDTSSTHPGGRKSGSNAAGVVGSRQPRQKEGEKMQNKLRISLARCLRALETKIEQGLSETRAHLERKFTWMQSTFESSLEKHLSKHMKEQQAASGKRQLKHTAFVFLGVLTQMIGLVAMCLYAGYLYGWPYIEQKVYEIAYDDRAKALALQAFESGIKYAVSKITFQHARDGLRKKLPEWLGGRKEEKKDEKKEEEKVTTHRFMWCWVRTCNRWRKKAEEKKKEEMKKRKEEEEVERRKAEEKTKEEGEKNEKRWYSRLWCFCTGSWSKKDEVEEEGGE